MICGVYTGLTGGMENTTQNNIFPTIFNR